MDVTGDLFDFGGTFFEIQLYVAGDVFHGDVAVLVVDLDFAVAAGDGDLASTRSYLQRHLAGDGDIEIALHGVVAGGLSLGVEGQQTAGCGERRLRLAVVLVGVTLVFRAHALADRNGDFVVIGRR